jgi:rSAM/selenodomain-associated transferase 1
VTAATAGPSAPADPLAAIDIVVMARIPIVGQVKTRLAARVGPQAACQLYTAMLTDLSARLRALPGVVTWLWTPAGLARPFVGSNARHADQCDGDLGARMERAIADRWQASTRPVLVLGVDAPQIEIGWLRTGAEMLLRGLDVVLGPAEDGGYWAIGVQEPRPPLFADIPWSTPAVFDTTIARAREHGWSIGEMPCTFDLDEWDDIQRIRTVLAGDPSALPALALALADLTPA